MKLSAPKINRNKCGFIFTIKDYLNFRHSKDELILLNVDSYELDTRLREGGQIVHSCLEQCVFYTKIINSKN